MLASYEGGEETEYLNSPLTGLLDTKQASFVYVGKLGDHSITS